MRGGVVLRFDPADLMVGEVFFEDGLGIEAEGGEDGGHIFVKWVKLLNR